MTAASFAQLGESSLREGELVRELLRRVRPFAERDRRLARRPLDEVRRERRGDARDLGLELTHVRLRDPCSSFGVGALALELEDIAKCVERSLDLVVRCVVVDPEGLEDLTELRSRLCELRVFSREDGIS